MARDRTRHFTIGSPVWCGDGACGQLWRVVIEPVERVLTHLIVQSDHRDRACRLVPLDVVESSARGTPDEIVLHCSLAEFETFELAQETQFLAGASGHWTYRQEQMLTWPHYRLAPGGGPAVVGTLTSTRDRAPFGDIGGIGNIRGIQVRRGDRVQATDGSIGRVQGLVVDRVDHRVTHVLLDESHLWDLKRTAIPIGAVVDMKDGVRLDLTTAQVRSLPPVELDVQD